MFFLFFLTACASSKSDTSSTEAFQGGVFQFTSVAVDDYCLDGAFSVLFLPDGTSSDWQYPIELPNYEDLPQSYVVSLQAPFTDMGITTSAGSNRSIVISDGLQLGILFDETSYPDCIVDLGIEALITVIDNDTLSGRATLSITDPSGDTCPAFGSNPCEVGLDFQGYRL